MAGDFDFAALSRKHVAADFEISLITAVFEIRETVKPGAFKLFSTRTQRAFIARVALALHDNFGVIAVNGEGESLTVKWAVLSRRTEIRNS